MKTITKGVIQILTKGGNENDDKGVMKTITKDDRKGGKENNSKGGTKGIINVEM
jgi:hypothetical protein